MSYFTSCFFFRPKILSRPAAQHRIRPSVTLSTRGVYLGRVMDISQCELWVSLSESYGYLSVRVMDISQCELWVSLSESYGYLSVRVMGISQ